VAVVKEMEFKKLFLEMAGIGMGVAFISFLIGWAIRMMFHIEI